MTFLSPHAEKARWNAAARDSLWQPQIGLEKALDDGPDLLVVRHAINSVKERRRTILRTLMGDVGMKWSGRPETRFFHIERTNANYLKIVKALAAKGIKTCQSFAVSNWIRDTALPVAHTNGRSKLFKV